MTHLSVSDLIAAGSFNEAVTRMQRLCAIQDPETPVDVDAVRTRYMETRDRLRAELPPAPVRIYVDLVRS